MFVDKAENMSVPYIRDIFTINLSPSLASQAPKVNIINAKTGEASIFAEDRVLGIISTKERSIPSKQNRDISKWDRWKISAVKVKINGRGKIKYIGIDLMNINRWFTRPVL